MKIAPFRLEQYFAKYEFSVPYPLCSSDCESMPISKLLEFEPDAGAEFTSLNLGYTEPRGAAELRRAIAALYQQISTDQILVHAGAQEAIFNFMNIAIDPGDHVIVQSPYYQSLGEVARSNGAEVTRWWGDVDNFWALYLDQLKNALTAETKVVVINVPHNPNGFLPTEKFMRDLSVLSDQHGFIVISDEVYRGLEQNPRDRLPAFADINQRAVSLGVLSKAYGLAGLRIGWLATSNEEIYKQLLIFKDYTTICNSAPSEFLAALALRHSESIIARNMDIIRGNLSLLDLFFKNHEDLFSWRRPEAGPIAFPGLKKGSADSFCHDLVTQAGVLLLPGSVYEDNLNSFRIGFGRKNMPECLEKLTEFVNATT